jgi:GDP-D-mannose dehydratase
MGKKAFITGITGQDGSYLAPMKYRSGKVLPKDARMRWYSSFIAK